MAAHYNALTVRLLNTAKTFVTRFQANPTANRTVSIPDRDGVVVLTGTNNTFSGSNSTALGSSNTASGTSSIALGHSNQATDYACIAVGGFSKSDVSYKFVIGCSNALFTLGGSQTGTLTLTAFTTNNTPTILVSNSGAPSGNNQLLLPSNSAFAFNGVVIVRQQASGGNKTAFFEFKGLIRKESFSSSTTLVYSEVIAKHNPDNLSVALSADTVQGVLKITVTGLAATNLVWVASIRSAETIYA